MSLRLKTHNTYIVLSGIIVTSILAFIFYKTAEGVILDPKNTIQHTVIVYYDGRFSDSANLQNINTALYVVNESNENIYATTVEYEKWNKVTRNAIQIAGNTEQFIKMEKNGFVYLKNENNSRERIVRFSKWAK